MLSPVGQSDQRVSAAALDVRCELMRDSMLQACAGETAFPDKVGAAVRAAFQLLTAEVEFVRSLTSYDDPADTEHHYLQQLWEERFAEVLRRCAADAGVSKHPRFVESMLIGGIRQQIGAKLDQGGVAALAGLDDSITELLIFFYGVSP